MTPQSSIIQLWNDKFVPRFSSMSYADFSDWLARSGEGQGYLRDMAIADLRNYISCNLRLFNDLVGRWKGRGNKPFVCICYGTSCCRQDESCPNPTKRLALGPGRKGWESSALREDQQQDSGLASRAANDYTWSADRNGQTYSGTYTAIAVSCEILGLLCF